MFPAKEFEKRMRDVLNEMDEVLENEELDEEALEELSELNAETEDALLLLSELDSEEEDAAEAIEDALDEFIALAEDYSHLAVDISTIQPAVQRLNMIVEMMKNNI